MYNVNEISQVNKKYIFLLLTDGRQDRQSVNLSELKTLYLDVSEKMKCLDFTVNYNRDFYNELTLEYEKQEKIIEFYEKYIEEHKEDPLVRRGLHDGCYALTTANNKRQEIALERAGVSHASIKASDEYWKLYRIKKQIEAVFQGGGKNIMTKKQM